MTGTSKWLLPVLALLLSPLFGPGAQAQVVNAASCSQADVQTALNAVVASTATVNIPAGTCTWTSGIVYVMNSATTNLTVIGAGNSNCPSSCDNATTIIDEYNHSGGPTIFIGNGPANFYLRFSGITIKDDSATTPSSNGAIDFGGNTSNLRVDHCHFWVTGTPSGTVLFSVVSALWGVFDHNLYDLRPSTPDQGVRINGWTSFGDSSTDGNGAWAAATNFGGSNFMFFENNTFNGGVSNDCNAGGRQVFRNNTFNQSSVQTHEMESDARGCRATEVYNNTFTGMTGDTITSFTAVGLRMGTALIWGNSSTFMENLITIANDRTNGHPEAAAPNGFGYCGTLGALAGPSAWDGNSIGSTGYPCIDFVGRGQSDVLTGQFPKKCDATTGCTTYNGSWPHNKLEPVYEWLNRYQIGTWQNGVYYNQDPNAATANRDYYQYTLSWNGSAFTGTPFNGTVGTGSGPLSARPSACTAGPGGTYGVSPTGSFGVAYWATDTNTLYVCTATNTWTTYYTPYTYPHPLTLGSGNSSSSTPAPPSNVKATVQ